MNLSFERTVLTMLFSKFVFVGIIFGLILYMISAEQAQQQIQQTRSNQTGARIIKQIFDKLDALHVQSNQLVNAQGNISMTQRQALINELTDLQKEGGIASRDIQIHNLHILQEILDNVTSRK